jgi:hypothetical protein
MFPCGLGPGVDRPGQPMAVIIELFFVMAAKGKVKNLAEFTAILNMNLYQLRNPHKDAKTQKYYLVF